MRLPNLGVRQRIFGALLIIAAVAAALMVLLGARFHSVLRSRARESCVRMAGVFSGIIHARLLSLVAEAKGLAEALSGAERSRPGHGPRLLPAPGAKGRICSWALYDAAGRLEEGCCLPEHQAALSRLGIGSPELPPRERGRLAAAVAGRGSTVLVPNAHQVYALHYTGIPRQGKAAAALQVAAEVAHSIFPGRQDAAGVRVAVRPFVASAAKPRRTAIEGEPFLIVHRPLVCGTRHLGTVAVAVPYGAEIGYEIAVTFSILLVGMGSLFIFGALGYQLTSVAMVPLDRVSDFIRSVRSGHAVECLSEVPGDESGALLEAFQGVLKQSQDWADRLMESSRVAQDLMRGAAEALVNAIEAKDEHTAGHSQRVAEMACAMATTLGWEPPAIEELRLGAILHDMGKVGVHLDILNKPARLSSEEYDVVCQHPVVGARIISAIPGCDGVVRAVLHHHERYDGTGYPTGARGEDIPIAARIISIADVFDALTSQRSYRPAHSVEAALAILDKSRGSFFDPGLVELFLTMVRDGYQPPRARRAKRADNEREPGVAVSAGHPPEILEIAP